MANPEFQPIYAVDLSSEFVKSMPFDRIGTRILDTANKFLWMRAPWRWTIDTLPSVTLVSDTQTYSIALPADYLYPFDSFRTDGDDDTSPLYIDPILPTISYKGPVQRIAITGTAGGTGTLTTAPTPGTVASPAPDIVTLYKKQATRITKETAHTAGILGLPDEWFWVYESAVLYFAYLYADDSRAGEGGGGAGNFKYSGQRAILEANIMQMLEHEKLPTTPARTGRDQRGEA
jgi:hypothetical protein